jgi:CBS domain-containing protein
MAALTVQEILENKARGGGNLFTVSALTPVAEAVAIMVNQHIGSVVVLESGKMAGLITLRQVVNALHRLGGDLWGATASAVMNPDPVIATPELSADQLRKIMAETKVTHVPVLDGTQVKGILSFHDVARAELSQTEFENSLLKKYIKNWPE